MGTAEDIALVARQEAALLLPAFNADVAWQLGTVARDLAIKRGQAIVIDLRRFGQPHEHLFYAALPGTTPDNGRWVERKVNVVARFHRSSYAMGLKLRLEEVSFTEKYALPDADYTTHGGCFPLRVPEAGVVGSLTISGLPQRADHELAVEVLCLHLGLDYGEWKLTDEALQN